MSAQENAEAIIIVIKKVGIWLLIITLILALLFLGILAYNRLHEYFSYDRHKNLVYLSATFNKEQCTVDYPLLITLENSSTKTIMSVNADVEVTQVGKSSRLNDYKNFKDDTIIISKKIYGFCNSVAYDSKFEPQVFNGTNMVAKVSSFSVVFE